MSRSPQATAVGCAVMVAGLASSLVLAAEPRLLEPGQYHGNEVTAVTGERWLALVRGAGANDRLAPVTIRVDTVRDELLDEDGPATGKLVAAASGDDSIVFLVADIAGLRAGPVTTMLTDVDLAPGEPAGLAMRGARYTVSLECARVGRTGAEQVSCSLVVRHRDQAQILRTYTGYYLDGAFGGVGNDARPTIIWAGDLDGDGALDLLIDISDH